MDIEILIDRLLKEPTASDYNQMCEVLSEKRVYFFIIDDGSLSKLDQLIFVDKDKPISFPAIKDKETVSSVLYTSRDVALKHIEKGLRLSHKKKGIEAIKFMLGSKKINEIIVQGKNGWINIEEKKLREMLDIA